MTPFAVVAGLALFRPLLSPKVLNEYGRGVILRPGKVLSRSQGAGPDRRGVAHRPHGASEPQEAPRRGGGGRLLRHDRR
jgi:hypothetical protein